LKPRNPWANPRGTPALAPSLYRGLIPTAGYALRLRREHPQGLELLTLHVSLVRAPSYVQMGTARGNSFILERNRVVPLAVYRCEEAVLNV